MANTALVEKVKTALLTMQRHSWEQGVAMQALLELGDMELVVLMAKEVVARQTPDGRTGVLGGNDAVTDPCSVGEALGAAASWSGDETLQDGYDRLLDWALVGGPRNADGVLYHLDDRPEFWVDSMYMLPPFLAWAGMVVPALTNFYGYFDALYDEEAGLMSHKWDDDAKAYVRREHWGVGNGWALAACARMIDLLPVKYEGDRQKIIGIANTLIENLLVYMRSDGLFHDVVDDPSTFVETGLSQMLAYTLYRGKRSGWLPAGIGGIAGRLCRVVEAKVDKWGLVQGVCAAPHFDRPGVAPEAQAFFLLMQAVAEE